MGGRVLAICRSMLSLLGDQWRYRAYENPTNIHNSGAQDEVSTTNQDSRTADNFLRCANTLQPLEVSQLSILSNRHTFHAEVLREAPMVVPPCHFCISFLRDFHDLSYL